MSAPDPRGTLAPEERIICALDLPTLDGALRLVDSLDGSVSWFKIGMELFTSEGPRAVAGRIAIKLGPLVGIA